MKVKYYLAGLFRFVYYKFNFDKLYNPYKSKKNKKDNYYKLTLENIETAFKVFNIKKGDSILIHSAMSFIDEDAETIIEYFKNKVGKYGNVLMPTHPLLTKENGVEVYDITHSKSTVGYLTEMFRKSSGVKRSQHPLSSIAAWGKDQDYFLENNLNMNKPLPHGLDSSYYKFAQKGGKAILIGANSRRATIMHTGYEVLDDNFKVRDFFDDHRIIVKDNHTLIGDFIVREENYKASQLYTLKLKVLDDWKKYKALETIYFSGVPISCVLCKEAIDIMVKELDKKGNSYHPLAPMKNN